MKHIVNAPLYHGSFCEVHRADLSRSREDIDFGKGFYLTPDRMMAKKWASSRVTSMVNEYTMDYTGLDIHVFGLEIDWLEYVRANRGYGDNTDEIISKYKEFDVIIGPTADDKLFDTVQMYLDGYISAEQAIKYLNVAGYSDQIVLKTEKAIDKCSFVNCKELVGAEKQDARTKAKQDRTEACRKLNEYKKMDARMTTIERD